MRTMYRLSEFKWVAQKGAEQAVSDLLQPAVRFTRKDLGFPPLSYETRDVALSKKQKDAYDAMKKDLEIWTVNNRRIDAVNEGVLRGKLIQIACGAVYGADHEVHEMDAAPRLAALDDIIEEAGGKLLVFAALTSIVKLITLHISKNVSCEYINGDVGATQRNKIIQNFVGSRDPQVLVADPRTMAHGLNLSVVFNGSLVLGRWTVWNFTSRPMPGSTAPDQCGVVIHLASSPVEREIYRRLQEKKTLQGAILELLKRWMMFKIEKKVAIPDSGYVKWPFNNMIVGDSFSVPVTDATITRAHRRRGAAAYARKRNGRKYVVRAVDGGRRCWRTL